MLLHFRDVVRDVIDDMHVEVIRGSVECLRKCLPCEECHALSVHPCITILLLDSSSYFPSIDPRRI